MKLETLLVIDILTMLSVPTVLLLLSTMTAVITASLLTAGLVYLDLLTYRFVNPK